MQEAFTFPVARSPFASFALSLSLTPGKRQEGP
jgi:hypothetical protein